MDNLVALHVQLENMQILMIMSAVPVLKPVQVVLVLNQIAVRLAKENCYSGKEHV